jgi:integrase/recombinase XerD
MMKTLCVRRAARVIHTGCFSACSIVAANTLTHIINSFYQKTGIANASSHSGRRSGLTTLADKGVSVRVLMAIAGHSQISTTQRYIDLRPSVVKAAVELI